MGLQGAIVEWRWQLPFLILVALLLRSPLFGDPVIHSDEQFYLLVGDRLLHGAVPYVDIWDRKPIGLFLIFAVIRLLGGVGIVQYQVVAALSAGCTAWIVARIASRPGHGSGAVLAGAVYLVWLLIFDGAGGQTPVLYNLPIAAAGLLTLRMVEDPTTHRRSAVAQGCIVMLLVGLALQINYICVFQGVFFGLVLLWHLHRTGHRPAEMVVPALLWCGVAVLPTLLALSFYILRGEGAEFMHANFVSIFLRVPAETATATEVKLLAALAGLAPLLLCALARVRGEAGAAAGQRRSGANGLLLLWAAAALLSALAVGSWEGHYFLPVLVPLSAACARGLYPPRDLVEPRWWRRGRAALPAGLLGLGLIAAIFVMCDHVKKRGNARQMGALVAMIQPHMRGCMFAFGSEPILYHLTRSCLPSRHIFRSHLSQSREAAAIGVDASREVRRVFGTRPGVVVVREAKKNSNAITLDIVRKAVERDYWLAGAVKVGSFSHSVYVRRMDGI